MLKPMMKSAYCERQTYANKSKVIVRSYIIDCEISPTWNPPNLQNEKKSSFLTFPVIFSLERPRIYLLAIASSLCVLVGPLRMDLSTNSTRIFLTDRDLP